MTNYKLVISCIFLYGCMTYNYASAAVVSSIKPLAFISAAITEGISENEVLLSNGASPHSYTLKPSDIKRLQQAELIIWIGKDMETFLAKPIQQIKPQKVLTLSQWPAIQPLLIKSEHHHDHSHDGDDSAHTDADHDHSVDWHIWLSPEIAEQIAKAIYNKLIIIYPDKKERLTANLQLFIEELHQNDQKLGKLLSQVKGKGYFVFHDAYHYFEQAFGLTQTGYFTINPEIQPGAKRLHQIRTELVDKKVQCVFAEPQFQPTVINSITQGLDIKQSILDPLGMNIKVSKSSYIELLTQLSSQFLSCLKNEN